MSVVARHYSDGRWIELTIRGRTIEAVRDVRGPSSIDFEDDWVAPAFWDIQVNGRWGHSFSSPDLTGEQVDAIVRAQALHGTARFCPTLITAPVPDLLHGLRTIASACERSPEIASRVLGIHLEGPFISDLEGYRGAHPPAATRDADWGLFERLQEAAGGRIILITLAPERDNDHGFLREATKRGLVVAIGHTATATPMIRCYADFGATLSTHLGNGIPSLLPRHPNLIWEQAACDDLSASFIADGHHVDVQTLRVLARAKGPGRTILISDFSPLAGLPPGTYGDWAVDPSGKIVVAGTPYLAGANRGLEVGVRNLYGATGWGLPEVLATVTTNPARVLGRPEPRLDTGEPASFILFRRDGAGVVLKATCVDGEWCDAVEG